MFNEGSYVIKNKEIKEFGNVVMSVSQCVCVCVCVLHSVSNLFVLPNLL